MGGSTKSQRFSSIFKLLLSLCLFICDALETTDKLSFKPRFQSGQMGNVDPLGGSSRTPPYASIMMTAWVGAGAGGGEEPSQRLCGDQVGLNLHPATSSRRTYFTPLPNMTPSTNTPSLSFHWFWFGHDGNQAVVFGPGPIAGVQWNVLPSGSDQHPGERAPPEVEEICGVLLVYALLCWGCRFLSPPPTTPTPQPAVKQHFDFALNVFK